jgi:hypothetical protein
VERAGIKRLYLATTGLQLAPGIRIPLGEIHFSKRKILIGLRSIVRRWMLIAQLVNTHVMGNIREADKTITIPIEITSHNASAPKNDSGCFRMREAFANCLRNNNRTCATVNGCGSR